MSRNILHMEEKEVERNHRSPVGHKRLPRDEFWGYSTWMLFKHRLALLIFAMCIIFAVWLLRKGLNDFDELILSLIIIFDVLFVTFAVVRLVAIFTEDEIAEVMSLRNRMHFLNEVIENRPGVTMDKWDVVAANINETLASNGSYTNSGYFFDGEMCHDEFKRLFMRDSEASEYPELIKYIEKALRVYQANVDAYWSESIQKARGK